MENQTEELLAIVDFEKFYREKVEIKSQSNDELKGNCPFHEDKVASFSAKKKTGVFRCCGCGIRGSVFQFIEKLEKVTFAEAVKTLADFSGFKLQNREGILLHKSAARLNRSEDIVLLFPNLETVIFITFFHNKFMISECFTHTDDGALKPFFSNGLDLFFDPEREKETSVGILLYASGMDALDSYLGYLIKAKKDAEFVLIPAVGGRLEEVRKILEAAK